MKRVKLDKLYLSMALSIILFVLGYFVNNLPVFTGENLNQFFLTQKFCELFGHNKEFDHSDALFINVSHDKQLVEVQGNGPFGKLGNTAITDRAKLYDLLKVLDEKGTYKYIIVDLIFNPKDVTESDSLLYSLIESMNNIVIVRDDSIPAPIDYLQPKAALADYCATITATNFVRYQYLSKDNLKYIPLKVYEDLNQGAEFRKFGLKFLPIYTSEGKLCYNSNFIAFDGNRFSSFSEITKQYANKNYAIKNYYNLGTDLLAIPILSEQERIDRIVTLSQDKYVIVGNLTEDLHDTYMGVKPGSLILYRALKTLEEGKHIVRFCQFLYWFIAFTLIFLGIFNDVKFRNIFPSRKSKLAHKIFNNNLIGFIFASFTYVSFLFVLSTIEYAITHKIYSIVLPSFVFMLTRLVCDYQKFKYHEN